MCRSSNCVFGPPPIPYGPAADQESSLAMQNAINLLMLLCAIFASLGFGVFSAYALCRFGFLCMRRHAATTRTTPLRTTPIPSN